MSANCCYIVDYTVTSLSTDSHIDPGINSDALVNDDDADDDSDDINVGGVDVVIVTSQSALMSADQQRRVSPNVEQDTKPETSGQGRPPFIDDDQIDSVSLPDNYDDVNVDHQVSDVRHSSQNERLFSPVMAPTQVTSGSRTLKSWRKMVFQ